MKFRLKIIFIAILVSLFVGCATPISDGEKSSIEKIGIINSFDKNPNYKVIGTTIFTNKESLIEELQLNEFIRGIVAEYLDNKGYQVIDVDDETTISNGIVDMTIEIVPRDARNKPFTYGYGFLQKTTFGVKGAAQSYIALNLVPKSNRAKNPFSAYYHENFVKLNIETLPNTWSELSGEQRQEMTENLKANIAKTVNELIPKLGL